MSCDSSKDFMGAIRSRLGLQGRREPAGGSLTGRHNVEGGPALVLGTMYSVPDPSGRSSEHSAIQLVRRYLAALMLCLARSSCEDKVSFFSAPRFVAGARGLVEINFRSVAPPLPFTQRTRIVACSICTPSPGPNHCAFLVICRTASFDDYSADMDYDPMVMDDAEALGPVVKISQVCLYPPPARLIREGLA